MMTTPGPTRPDRPVPSWHAPFLAMLPAIRRRALWASRGMPAEAREDLVQEVIDNSLIAYVRLAERGKAEFARPGPLSRYALAQFRVGRFVAQRLNNRDVSAPYAQRRRGLRSRPLEGDGGWAEALVADKRATPAELAASRLDFAAWLGVLPRREQRIALALAAGSRTSEVARQFGLTAGRVSQLRRWFRAHWEDFQSDDKVGRRPRSAPA
jgi:DNA-binding NarL/FixJ family response regulator